jgi:hypothetical protein
MGFGLTESQPMLLRNDRIPLDKAGLLPVLPAKGRTDPLKAILAVMRDANAIQLCVRFMFFLTLRVTFSNRSIPEYPANVNEFASSAVLFELDRPSGAEYD